MVPLGSSKLLPSRILMTVCDCLKIIVYMSILFYLRNIRIISYETQELLSVHVGIINKTNAAFIFTFPAISSVLGVL